MGACLYSFFAFLSNSRFLALLRNEESGGHLKILCLKYFGTFLATFPFFGHKHIHCSTISNTMAIKLSTTQRQKIRLILALILLACYHNSICVRAYLKRAALVSPDVSPWQKLYDEGYESLFLHITGLTQDAFGALLHTVIPPGHYINRPRRGRPWSLPPDGMLSL